jgi:hypothetical protein
MVTEAKYEKQTELEPRSIKDQRGKTNLDDFQ